MRLAVLPILASGVASFAVVTSGCSGGSAGTSDGGAPLVDQRPAGVALCYTKLADQHPATLAFWDAFAGAKPEARASAISGLQAAVKAYPKEEEFALLLGLGELWRVAEPMPSEVSDTSGYVQAALAAESDVQLANTLCPTDYRTDAWLGPILVRTGEMLNSATTIDQGMQALQKGIDHYPSFVLFSKLLVYADRAATDPDFQNALKAVQDDMSACGNPATSPDPACRDTPHAAHNIEGSMVFLGDVYAKAGKKDDALNYYAQAKSGPAYASWAFKDLIGTRVATIDARIAASSAGDSGVAAGGIENVWNSNIQCTICHER